MAVLWLALALLRRRSATARYAVSCAALALMALMPVATAAELYVRALPAGVSPPAVSRPRASQATTAPGPTVAREVRRPVAPREEAGWMAQLQPWALPLWAVGVLLFSMRLVSAGVHVRRLERRSASADDGILQTAALLARRLGVERPVRVLVASIADGPATLGWLHPVILLPPAALMGITPRQLEALLAHELAHVRRHDYLVNVVQMVLETVFFYHPAIWWSSRRIRIERELCCDDVAVESCGDALSYAQALTRVAKLRVAEPALGSTNGPLLGRIQRVLGRPAQTQSSPPAWTAAALVVTIMALVVTTEHAHAAPPRRRLRARQASSGVRLWTRSPACRSRGPRSRFASATPPTAS